MSDEELLERIRLGMGYLLAHGRLQQCDDIRELCARLAEAKAEKVRPLSSLETAGDMLADAVDLLPAAFRPAYRLASSKIAEQVAAHRAADRGEGQEGEV